ncbi:MAG: mucoidy inhibitor MuiA family protein [Planctomycetota bacterium]
MKRTGLGWAALAIVAGAVGFTPLAVSAGEAAAPPSGKSATLREGEKELQSRIQGVTVYSDRALVRRTANLRLVAGKQWVVLPGLPVSMDDASVRAKPPAGAESRYRVLSLEVRTDFREKFTKEEAEKLREDLRQLQQKMQGVQDQMNRLSVEESLLQAIRIQPPPQSKDNPKPRELNPGAWSKTLEFVQTRTAGVQEARRAATKSMRDLKREAAEIQSKLSQVQTYRRLSEKSVALEVECPAGSSGEAAVEVSYILPRAAWYPSYDIRVQAKAKKVEITTYGVIQQSTGEDWKEVDLELSTAMPATGADIPELKKWVLREAQEPIVVAKADFEISDHMETADALTADKANAMLDENAEMARAAADAAPERRLDAAPKPKKGRRAKGAGRAPQVLAEAPAAAPPATAAMEPGGWEAQGAAGGAADMKEDSEVASVATGDDYEGNAVKSAPRGRWAPGGARKNLEAAPRGPAWPPSFPCPLPVQSAGGYDFKFKSVRPDTIPSDGKAYKTVLAVEEIPADLFYETAPVMEKLAFLKGTFKNGKDLPMLEGPARVFLDTDFVGDMPLKTIAPTQDVSLSLGADENISIKREENEISADKGVFSTTKETRHEVVVTVKNGKDKPVKLVVFDRMPFTDHEDVKVTLVASQPTAEAKSKGLLKFTLDLAPGAEGKATFAYTVRRPPTIKLVPQIQPPEEEGN